YWRRTSSWSPPAARRSRPTGCSTSSAACSASGSRPDRGIEEALMQTFPHRPAAALPGERVVDVTAPPIEGEPPIRTVWEILAGRRWLVFGFTAVVVAAVAIWTFTARPLYEASTVIQIDPERPRVLSFAEVTPREEPYNERVVDAYYQTQLE